MAEENRSTKNIVGRFLIWFATFLVLFSLAFLNTGPDFISLFHHDIKNFVISVTIFWCAGFPLMIGTLMKRERIRAIILYPNIFMFAVLTFLVIKEWSRILA